MDAFCWKCSAKRTRSSMAEFKNIKGGKELDAFLKTLPAKMEKNIMRSALRKGANEIRNEAKANVPVDRGDLKKSLKVSTGGKRGKIIAKVKSGLRYAHLVEFGTAAHKIEGKNGGFLFFNGMGVKSVHHPGSKAQPFMRPALDSKANAAIVAVGNQIRARLTKQGINAGGLEVEE